MKKKSKLPFIIVAAVLLIGVIAGVVCFIILGGQRYRLIKVEIYEGDVDITRESKDININEGMRLKSGDKIHVDTESLLELLVDSDKHILASENTRFEIRTTGTEDDGKVTIKLTEGDALFTIDNKLPRHSEFIVNTPNATLSVRGTTFNVNYSEDADTTAVSVAEGAVLAESGGTSEIVEAGYMATINEEGITISKDISLAKVGDTVTFGTYYDDPIEWDVLAVYDDRVLLISHYVLTTMKYNDINEDTNWRDCTLREWLNGEFYDTSFSDYERSRIETVNNDNSGSAEFYASYCPDLNYTVNPNPCGNTEDKVYLLSINEFIKYYGIETDGSDLYSQAGAATRPSGGGWGWWLRTSGRDGKSALYMGYEIFEGDATVSSNTGVRPVICVSKL